MNLWNRAILYITRKKNRSIILSAILFVIFTLTFLGVAIGNAADSALMALRSTMGGYFKIRTNVEQGYSDQVDEAFIQKIVDLGGIKNYNGLDVVFLQTEGLELEPGRFTFSGDENATLARFMGNTESELNEYFVLRSFALTQGRHIMRDDFGKAVISEQLANRNKLSLGDTIKIRRNQEGANIHELEVIGIYRIDTNQGAGGADTAECDIAENFIFTDTKIIREIHEAAIGRKIEEYSSGVTFFVDDPAQLENCIRQMQGLEDYNWDAYVIKKNNKIFDDVEAPLARMSGLFAVMVYAVMIMGCVILILILMLWLRDRVHEIGIYMSIGIKKCEIILQLIAENMFVMLMAGLLAFCIAFLSTGVLEKFFIESVTTVEEIESSNYGVPLPDLDDTIEAEAVDVQEYLSIMVGAKEVVQILMMGCILVIISTSISSALMVRLKPKEIFTQVG